MRFFSFFKKFVECHKFVLSYLYIFNTVRTKAPELNSDLSLQNTLYNIFQNNSIVKCNKNSIRIYQKYTYDPKKYRFLAAVTVKLQ